MELFCIRQAPIGRKAAVSPAQRLVAGLGAHLTAFSASRALDAYVAANLTTYTGGADPCTAYVVDVCTPAEAVELSRDGAGEPVFKGEAFWRGAHGREVRDRLCPAIAADDAGVVEYFESPDKLARMIPTRAKVGRFLQAHWGAAGLLTAGEVEFFADWQRRGVRGENPAHVLRFASDSYEIARVYEDGPHSCMAGESAVRVYGAGDLAIAYLEGDEDTQDEGTPVARVLCWPARKVYGRVYPDASEPTGGDLIARLRREGYKSQVESGGAACWNGAKLFKEQSDYGSGYVMPYLDHFNLRDGGRYWIAAAEGPYSCEETNGIMGDDENSAYCEHCHDSMPEDEANTVHDGWNPTFGATGEETWCDACVRADAFTCEATHERYTDHQQVTVTTANGDESWTSDYAEANAFHCERSGDYFAFDDFEAVEVLTSTGAETWACDTAKGDAFACALTGALWSRDDESDDHPGFPAELDGCDKAAAFRAAQGVAGCLLHLTPAERAARIPAAPCEATGELALIERPWGEEHGAHVVAWRDAAREAATRALVARVLFRPGAPAPAFREPGAAHDAHALRLAA